MKSSVGHIRDLPTAGSGKTVDPKERAKQAAKTRKMSPEKKAAYKKQRAREQLVRRMGIDPEQGWEARYEVLPGKEKVVNELKKLAADSDAIYLATDLDREGEAIAWHLREAIGGDESRFQRVVFNEITKKAIPGSFRGAGAPGLQPGQCATGAALPRPGGGLYGLAAALGQGGQGGCPPEESSPWR